MEIKDYYKLLGIQTDCSPKQLKRAYRKLAKKYHPDVAHSSRSVEMFNEITEAYDTLSDPMKRSVYDKSLGEKLAAERRRAEREKRFEQPTKRPSQELKDRLSKDRSRWERLRERGATDLGMEQKEQYASPLNRAARVLKDTQILKREPTSRMGRLFGWLLGAPSTSKSAEKESGSKKSSFLQNAQESLRGVFSDELLDRQREKAKFAKPRSPVDALRGERYFTFSINTLESIVGTTREVVLGDLISPRKTVVTLPPGTKEGPFVEIVNLGEKSMTVKANVSITPHPLIDREGDDIVLKVALTVSEALEGVELEVPTLEGPVKVRIPPGWQGDKRLRLKERGLLRENKKSRGDMYIRTHVVMPDKIDESAMEAGRKLDSHYSAPVRKPFPKNLRDL